MRGARHQKSLEVEMADMIFLKEMIDKIFEDTLRIADKIYITSEGTWSPPVDLYETESEFIVKAEVPEIRQEDIFIKLDSNLLTIEGERRFRREKIEGYHRIERPYGRFKRSFILPESVDSDSVRASLQNGVLKIMLPKKEGKTQTHIDISD